MSTGPVARWLDTFVYNSKQYAEIFKKFGIDNLNEVCKLDPIQLTNMGINSIDSDKIMENIFVLRQTLQVSKMNTSATAPVTTQKPARKSKAKATKQQAIPNVTINQVNANGMPVSSMPVMRQAMGNQEAAKKIGNEIMQMANNSQTNTKYTCIPINQNQNYNYQNQYNYNQTPSYQYNGTVNSSSYRPMNQNYGYYNNWNQSQEYYNNNYYQGQQFQPTQQPHSNDFYSHNYKQSNNNSPLEYLERLAQMPESSQVVDPKSIVNTEGQLMEGINFDDINKNNKRMNLDGSDNCGKKVCSSASSSNSNSPNFKLSSQQRYLNISSDSPSSSSTCSSTSSAQQPLLNNQTDIVSANLIDTSNFDFLDFLPELNSNTIDQTITSSLEHNEPITSSTSSASSSSQIDNLLTHEQVSQNFQFNNI